MAIARSPSARSERGARSGAFLARHRMVIAAGVLLLAAFIALISMKVSCRPMHVPTLSPAPPVPPANDGIGDRR